MQLVTLKVGNGEQLETYYDSIHSVICIRNAQTLSWLFRDDRGYTQCLYKVRSISMDLAERARNSLLEKDKLEKLCADRIFIIKMLLIKEVFAHCADIFGIIFQSSIETVPYPTIPTVHEAKIRALLPDVSVTDWKRESMHVGMLHPAYRKIGNIEVYSGVKLGNIIDVHVERFWNGNASWSIISTVHVDVSKVLLHILEMEYQKRK